MSQSCSSSLNTVGSTSGQVSQRIFPDERNGKICCILGARDLCIAWGDNPSYWKWRPHADSRFSEIAELNAVWWLDIRGKIDINMLSSKTFYAAYLVFRLREGDEGLNVGNATIRFLVDESDEDAAKRAKIVHLHASEDRNEDKAVRRDDGWMEVEMGNFYLAEGDKGEVEARLLETTTWKTGLIVEAIEFRPICVELSKILHLDKKTVLPKIRCEATSFTP